MAPGPKVLEAELVKVVEQLWHTTDHANLSVNAVRSLCEKKLHLDEDFFKQPDWKNRSKNVIRNRVDQLEAAAQNGENPSSQVSPGPQNGQKRAPPADATPPKKRQKVATAEKPDRADKADSSGKLAKPKPTKKAAAPAAKPNKKKKPVESDGDGEEEAFSDESPVKRKKKSAPLPTRRRASAAKSYKESSSSEEEAGEDSETADTAKDEILASPIIPKPPNSSALPAVTKPSKKKPEISDGDSPLSELEGDDIEGEKAATGPAEEGSSSELSELLDDDPAPPKKQKSKPRDSTGAKKSAKPKAPKPAAQNLDADEAEVKKLQGHLARCGVRKIWAFELKKYGDDNKAKIRHLKEQLREVGMDGRFSEAKAREIKERRELEADLAAVTEMNKAWGMDGGGGRVSRSRVASTKKKSYVEDDDDEGEAREKAETAADDDGVGGGEGAGDEEEDEDDEDAPHGKGRGSARYRAELAFLDDESESD